MILLGENEIKENNFKLKNMSRGKETSISFTDLEKAYEIIKGTTNS